MKQPATPQTDRQEIVAVPVAYGLTEDAPKLKVVPSVFARKLERDLNAAQSLVDAWNYSQESGFYGKLAGKFSNRLKEVQAELRELNELFDLQHKRTVEAVKLWRTAHPERGDIIPDLGELLQWLIDERQIKS